MDNQKLKRAARVERVELGKAKNENRQDGPGIPKQQAHRDDLRPSDWIIADHVFHVGVGGVEKTEKRPNQGCNAKPCQTAIRRRVGDQKHPQDLYNKSPSLQLPRPLLMTARRAQPRQRFTSML